VDTGDRDLMNVVTPVAADRFAGNRGADYRVDLPIEQLGNGEYLCVIEATEGQHTARRGVRFTVQ
jgi:hypothetical protein